MARIDQVAAVLVLAGAAIRLPGLAAQEPTPEMRIGLGFGVDTARSPNREILALYQRYLIHRLDHIQPNPDWSLSEQQRWPVFDLLSGYIQGFTNFTISQLAPAVGFDSTYVIRVLISDVDDSSRIVRPQALYRVYAVREAGRWVLANALPRMTRTWNHATIGHVTFFYPTTRSFARSRAAATSRFLDSLARAFALPVPKTDYYFTDDLSETMRVLGLEFFPQGDTVGGVSNATDHLVFVGSSGAGETYRHEVSHIVLQPLISQYHPPWRVMEGLMTWTGGSVGQDFRDLLDDLDGYLAQHPQVTLDTVLVNPPLREGNLDVGYDGAAALCAMVFEKGGVSAIRDWLSAGNDPGASLTSAARILGVSRAGLDSQWRGWIHFQNENRTSRNRP